ncbi:MAG: phosphate--acyl-ACP acyltransferase, partial [Tissierellia bacterium]|nr:phosphate--acyl-ACP acyltransferase [Tissierellia bacterium]
NTDSKPEYLQQFALMGSIYMEKVMGIDNPKVGLANIGTEEGKGNELAKTTYDLLKESNINFIGNVEGRDIPYGAADVIVADGFVGNMILKVTEGVALSLFGQLKDAFLKNTKNKIGALLLKSSLKELKSKIDYREYGGAPLLGTKQPIIKAHGSSDAYAIKNAIRQGINFVERDVIKTIEANL